MSSKSVGDDLKVSRTAAFTRFAETLRLYVGRGGRFSYKELERKSGVPARMIEAYRYEPDHEEWRAAPLEHVLSLIAALGPEFASDMLALADQGAFWLPDDGDPNPGEFAAETSENTTEIVRRAADGVFCAEDRKHLKAVGQRKIQNGMKLVAMGSKAA
ncbi:hypothetical protein M2336_001690 [Sphingobium sp. B1D7B]|uniref:hypothetical protein n=1 Tax=Sphingobium sp. B1D7B TaxID=2940578 RepID=UPI0022252BEE|nr:hypothetical protein [Sphingobium sp. B1D7B]MCW2405061.1 hypothetical protein [Sphingobium sp. B1D7B]